MRDGFFNFKHLPFNINSSVHRQYLILILLWMAVHALIGCCYFFPLHYDSYYYLDEATRLYTNGHFHDVLLFYRLYVILLAAPKFLSVSLVGTIIAFQCTLSLLSCLALYRAGSKLFTSQLAGFSCALIYILWFDMIRWNVAVMTESIFYSLTCLATAAVVSFRNERSDYLKIITLMALLVISRPTGVVVDCCLLIFIVAYHWQKIMSLKRIVRFQIVAVIFGSCLISGLLMLNTYDFIGEYRRGNIVQYMDETTGADLHYKSLQLDTSQLDIPKEQSTNLARTVYFISHNPAHFFQAASLKIGYLLTFYRPYYSPLHNIVIGIWMMIIYSLFVTGLIRSNIAPVQWFGLTLIAMNCVVVGISTLDWDNRFYITMAPTIILFAGGGVGHFRQCVTDTLSSGAKNLNQ